MRKKSHKARDLVSKPVLRAQIGFDLQNYLMKDTLLCLRALCVMKHPLVGQHDELAVSDVQKRGDNTSGCQPDQVELTLSFWSQINKSTFS
jgi:hypothetical protein